MRGGGEDDGVERYRFAHCRSHDIAFDCIYVLGGYEIRKDPALVDNSLFTSVSV